MKFQKLEKISLRNETKQYFATIVNYNNYNLYFGVANNFFGILISINDIDDEIEINDWTKIIFNNCDQKISPDNLSNLFALIEKSSDKSLEFYTSNCFLKFPVSLDLIDWLKAEVVIFEETKQDYQKISLPYINSILDKNTRWISDLIFKKSEESIVLIRNDNHVICKDIIWKNNLKSEFYILAIPIKQIKTIRDLIDDDIPLLEEIKFNCIQIAQNYGISKEKLYMFFHYHPSYYQLHLHACITEHPALETKFLRNYQIDFIIDALKNNSEYFKNATLKFELLTGTKLYNLLQQKQF